MGLRDRILDYVAKVFMPVPDHPARGGMTGEPPADADDEEDATGGDADGADADGSGEGTNRSGEGTDGSGETTDGTG